MRSTVLALAVAALLGQVLMSAQGAAPARRGPRLPAGVTSHRDNKTAADPNLIGQQVSVDGRAATVIGVAARDFHGMLRLNESRRFA